MHSEEDEKNWHQVASMEQLGVKDRIVTKIEGRQIAVFKTEAGIFAINNRCPHEGYPLLEGSLQDNCTLACNWHGWTFDLKTGRAIQGRDAVKVYPTKVMDAKIYLKIKPACPEKEQQSTAKEMDEAIAEHDYERIARSLCRYAAAGGKYETLAARTVLTSQNLFERGFGHAHAGMADWISLAGQDDDLRLVAFLEALGHFSWDGIFSPQAPISSNAKRWDEKAFSEAIERMDQAEALALCNGAFDEGWGFEALKPIFQVQIFSHYSGFGHPAIYLMKAQQLIAQLGSSVEQTICLQLTRYLCLAAREDLIPEFSAFNELLKIPPNTRKNDLPETQELMTMSSRQLMPLVATAKTTDIKKWDQMLAAAATAMLMFDTAKQNVIEQPIAQNVGWLDFTHAITFAEALYFHASEKPEFWQSGHLQQACFVGRNVRFLGDSQFEKFKVGDTESFLANQKAKLFDMDAGEYIYSVHRLKLVVAAEKLLRLVSPNTSGLLLAALNRFLSSNVRHKQPARTAYQARATVERE